MMRSRLALALLLLLALTPVWAAEPMRERIEWAALFDRYQALGTLLVVDGRVGHGQAWVHDAKRAQQRFSPASTFKIAHSLFALDAGVIEDEFQVISWDGVKRDIPAWNQDQTLRGALRHSAVWVFQAVARKLGEGRERRYLQAIAYGNADPSGGVSEFWLNGRLQVSAREQVDFLQRLYRNTLPFEVGDQRLVKDLMIVEAGRDWILRAKSGWSGDMGWWVGWVEWPGGPVFFALNLDTPQRQADLYKREAIVRAALQSLDALPAQDNPASKAP